MNGSSDRLVRIQELHDSEIRGATHRLYAATHYEDAWSFRSSHASRNRLIDNRPLSLKGQILTSRADNLLPAIMILFLGILLFDMMGLIIKFLSPNYGAAELSAYRNLFGLIPSAVALIWTPGWRSNGSQLRLRQWRFAPAYG